VFCDRRKVAGMSPKVRERVISMIPMRRLGRPEQITCAALFILQYDYYDGRILEIDGGLRI
jgi:3-oxoacyl-[acyl-carrier protein] reductase